VLVHIIEENHRIFDLLRKMLKNGEKYIFLHENAEFSGDIERYIDYNEVLVFKAVAPDGPESIALPAKIDLAVFGNIKTSINNNHANFSKAGTFLLNLENINKLTNIDFGSSQVITCGLREKDTVIFSSMNLSDGSVMLDLQRSIINIKGEPIEAFEKKIILDADLQNNSTDDAETILLALTVLLCCGRLG